MLVTTSDIIQKWLKYLHDTSGLSDRDIATKPHFSGIPAGTINTIRKHGKIPRKWKRRLGVVCPHCGRESHTYDCQVEKPVPIAARVIIPRKPRKRSPRLAISKADAASAALSIKRNLAPEVVREIKELL